MEIGLLVFLTIAVPLFGAFLMPMFTSGAYRLRNMSIAACVAVPLGSVAVLVGQLSAGQTFQISPHLPALVRFFLSLFTVDYLSAYMALASLLISAIIIVYSFDYISHYRHQREYYFMVALFIGSMMGIVFASNLVILYVFWELTAVASWRLIGFSRTAEHMRKADKAFLVTVFGALVMLIGFVMIYQRTGSFDFSAIAQTSPTRFLSDLVIATLLVGMFSKSATLPFHTWLADAGVAPSPVTALLHAAVLVKIGVYVFSRIFVATISLPEVWYTVVGWIAAASTIVSAACALRETDIKRIIAYSTVSQIGFIFFGLATQTAIGIAGALLYILMHGLAKAGLFLCAGIIEQKTKTKDITKLGGLLPYMPFTAVSFLFCAFSVMGIPPFGGFFSKYMVFAGAFEHGSVALALVFLVGAFMTLLYLFRVFNLIFMGECTLPQPQKEGSPLMVASVIACAVLSLIGGIFINYPTALVELAVRQMRGG